MGDIPLSLPQIPPSRTPSLRSSRAGSGRLGSDSCNDLCDSCAAHFCEHCGNYLAADGSDKADMQLTPSTQLKSGLQRAKSSPSIAPTRIRTCAYKPLQSQSKQKRMSQQQLTLAIQQ